MRDHACGHDHARDAHSFFRLATFLFSFVKIFTVSGMNIDENIRGSFSNLSAQ